ncbi:MAG: electron transport complex subunit E [Eubacteriales bacterium]|nr:electron transport complex subunit E [Eubacteriales bacterium]
MKKEGFFYQIYNGIIKENPTLVLMLGMCPTLAVTTSLTNAIGMGISTSAVLIFSNIIISLLRNIIPDRVRIPSYIVIVASLVTIVDLLMQAYTPALYEQLGIYIPLIVVNCIIFGRAESFAAKNKIMPSLGDGVGMGIGFTIGLSIIAIVREFLGSGSFYGINIIPDEFHISIFVLAPGAFFVLSILTAIQNKLNLKGASNPSNLSKSASQILSCNGDCMNCVSHIDIKGGN